MENQVFRVTNWTEICDLVKKAEKRIYSKLYKQLDQVFDSIKMDAKELYDLHCSVPDHNLRRKELYEKTYDALKNHKDFGLVEKWLDLSKDKQQDFINFCLSYPNKKLINLLVYEKIYHPITDKRISESYRREIRNEDWFVPPFPYVEQKRTCFNCGHKQHVYLRAISHSKSEVFNSSCVKCGMRSSFAYSFQKTKTLINRTWVKGVCFGGHFNIYFNEVKTLCFRPLPEFDLRDCLKSNRTFELEVKKILDKEIKTQDVSFSWDEMEQYNSYYKLKNKDPWWQDKLSQNVLDIANYINGLPDCGQKEKMLYANKAMENKSIEHALRPFLIKQIPYHIIDREQLQIELLLRSNIYTAIEKSRAGKGYDFWRELYIKCHRYNSFSKALSEKWFTMLNSYVLEAISKENTIASNDLVKNETRNKLVENKAPLNYGFSASTNSLFGSYNEKQVYLDLLAGYDQKRYYIGVNYPARRVFNFKKMPKEYFALFDGEQRKYLWNCIFDFVIYDLNNKGQAVLVLESQRGEHHFNDEAYKEKDLLKRRLCDLMGLDFKELFNT